MGHAGGQSSDAAKPLGPQQLFAQLLGLVLHGRHILADQGIISEAWKAPFTDQG